MTDAKTMRLDELLTTYRDTREKIYFETFINKMRPMLYRYFRLKGATFENVEDAFQRASIDLFLAIDRYDATKGDARRYFQRMVKNRLYTLWKSRHRKKEGVYIPKEIRFTDITPIYHFDESSLESPIQNEDAAAKCIAVQEALDTLNPLQREIAETIMNTPALKCGQIIADKHGISRQAVHSLRCTIRGRFEKVCSIRTVLNLDATPLPLFY